ncbi:murein hydrolase transporter LrgA [Lampropedia cohaerens]|uniref:Murein hydrolase transporter LrgA n=1 Tax=Lampropedia cohaerens TaxID=1610491 RepID=A0A0U1PXS3_9BURK|nr:CidA/LrgA family protein [Lampropedia cohaerens]KKW67175.1 murein hydrolase transporter LrgA [Lampropedia cohaerens]
MKGLQGLAALLVLQVLGELLARALALPIPGPVVGMVLLLPALQWVWLRQRVAVIAGFLLQHLSLLFVPVGVGVMVHLPLLQAYGWRIALVVVLSTGIGLAVTAALLHYCLRRSGS